MSTVLMWRRLAITFGLLCATAASAQDDAGTTVPAGRWVATWGTAQAHAVETVPDWVEPPPPELMPENAPPPPVPPIPDAFDDETVRMIARTSIGGSAVRVTFSNAAGRQPVRLAAVHVALHDEGSAIRSDSTRPVRFGGAALVEIPPGALVVSDPVELAVMPLTDLAISVYLSEPTATGTTHDLGLHTTYVAEGNAAAAALLSNVATNRSYFWLNGIEVRTDGNAGAIVAFGDSITDGYATTADADRAWPALLAERLQADAATAGLAVVNAGISGNRIRRDLIGTNGLARFERDVLARAGVDWIVLLEGVNDVTFSALPRAPADQRATADAIISALSLFIERAHARGIRVMGGTLTPMGGLWLHNPDTEAMRQDVNRWIRTSGRFDAVVDFDAAVRDPEDPARLRPEFDSGDHIHPNDAGNAAMADAIDIATFAAPAMRALTAD